MMRVLFLAVKLLIVGLISAWLIYNPGSIRIDWLGYTVETNVALVILALMLILAGCGFVWHIVKSIITLPQSITRYFNKQKKDKESQALYMALIAWEQRDEKFLLQAIQQIKNNISHPHAAGMTVYLEALQARLLSNSVTAQHKFRELSKMTHFEQLGHVGLLHEALMHSQPEHSWEVYVHLPTDIILYTPVLLKLLDVALTLNKFDQASSIVDQLKKQRSLTIDHVRQLRAQILLQQSVYYQYEQHNLEAAYTTATEAYNINPGSASALQLIRTLMARGDIKKMRSTLRFMWEEAPVEEMMVYLSEIADDDNALSTFNLLKKWSQDLPFHALRNTLLTRWAINAGLWGEARFYLAKFPDDAHHECLKNILLGDIELKENSHHANAIQHYQEAFKLIELA